MIDETFFALMQNALQAAQERNDDMTSRCWG